jgi:SAM-dependent methyltransferase
MSFTVSTESVLNPEVELGKQNFDRWLLTPAGRYFWEREAGAIDQHLKCLPGPHVLCLGSSLSARRAATLAANREFPYLYVVSSHEQSCSSNKSDSQWQSETNVAEGHRICSATPEALPFESDSMSSVLAIHSLEMCARPDQVLREINRVLQPEGYVLFSGFNTISPAYWGIGMWALRGSIYPKTIWHPRLVDWLRLLEFEVVASSMFAYAPNSIAARMPRASEAIVKAGDRWWPLLGGAYVLVARKTKLGPKLVGGRLTSLLAHGNAVLGSSSSSSHRQACESSDDCE